MISLMSLLEPAATFSERDPITAGADRVRRALAMRGWVDPRPFVPAGLSDGDRAAVLDAVAPDVETAWRTFPGRWYLRDQERRRLLTTSSPEDLDEALRPRDEADRKDPVRLALELRREPFLRDIPELPTTVLSAVGNTLVWLEPEQRFEAAGFWHADADDPGLRERIAATLAYRERLADIERLTSRELYGRENELGKLLEWSSEPKSAQFNGRFLYLSGVGGSGKSTLFAHLEKRLSLSPSGPILVHMDCDMAGFDPTDPIALDLALFRQLARGLPQHAQVLTEAASMLSDATSASDRAYQAQVRRRRGSFPSSRVHKAEEDENVHSFTANETAVNLKRQDRTSIIFDILWRTCGDRTLVLLFDTVELLFARGLVATAATAEWIASLRSVMGAPDARVVMAGRNPPKAPEVSTFSTTMMQYEWELGDPISLGFLSKVDAAAMLFELGIEDRAVAQLAAQVLPRTPLILKIAADVNRTGGSTRDAFVAQLRQSTISTDVIRRYLTERIIDHLTSPAARPYALAAMVLPKVTTGLLERVVLPVVDKTKEIENAGLSDRRSRSAMVLQGLFDAGWLVRREPDGKSLSFHPEVRRLALELMQADAKYAALVEAVRRAALDYYRTRRSKADATYRAYFEAILGVSPTNKRRTSVNFDLLGAAAEDISPEMRRLLDETSPRVSRLKEESISGAMVPVGSNTFSDEDWRRQVEGVDQRDGEGARLVKRGHFDAALELYRGRPTREAGQPPTFVLQALADGGHWRTGEVDVDAVAFELLQELSRSQGSVPNLLRSRIYWLTRFALLARPKWLSDVHRKVLKQAVERSSGIGPIVIFPAITAVAEALSWRDGPLAPEGWFQTRGSIESETRMFLVHHLHFARAANWKPHLDSLFVPQLNWPDVIGGVLMGHRNSIVGDWMNEFYRLARGYGERAPSLADFNSFLRDLRVPIETSIGPWTLPEDAVHMLRGLTTEFHRPLRAAIARYAEKSETAREQVLEATEHALSRLSFVPREFEPVEWQRRTERDLGAALTLAIPFIDRARRLPDLCKDLFEMSDGRDADVTFVAESFLRWDDAICRGRSSEWPRG